MRSILVSLALTSASCAATAASGTYVSGNKLLNILETDNRAAVMYVLGVSDSLAIDPVHRDTYCLPDEATGGQLADVVRLYLKDRPQYRHQDAATLTRLALLLAFACRK